MSIKAIIKGWWSVYKGWRQKIRPELKELFDARLNTCKHCEYLKYNVCTQCGCFVHAKTKVTDEHCPMNKWRPHLYGIDPSIILVEEVPSMLQPMFVRAFDATATADQWEEFLNNLEKRGQ